MKRLISLALACLAAACTAPGHLHARSPALQAGQHPQPPVAAGGYEYQLHLPPGAARAEPDEERWPLMIFLHGSGERGSDIAKVKVHGPPKIADRDPAFPFILVSPQLPAEQDWDLARLDALLDHALATLPVDPARIYLTGLSRGGHASWRWAAAEPGRFAAVAPVAGRGDPATACALTDVPIWALHGDRDDVVTPEGSFAMARAIRACDGRKSRLTIYPDLGHNAWDPAYDDPALYLWLLSHRIGGDAR
ncbi:dienelactone hydrolase family protein [Pelagerythrobacter marensis]|uniref:Esterase, PHB depolymerase family n=1 Tax=Pelagerythrobacter marensis TaxID=543877 RepID=A0A0G3X549_9SPHN|nr:alpha/beta hydrolase-fold protein [Pelagerythrobacter marensis]AKM06307.1 Esterase, PHB depolymerase family [Pelagerythrobacter marensis]